MQMRLCCPAVTGKLDKLSNPASNDVVHLRTCPQQQQPQSQVQHTRTAHSCPLCLFCFAHLLAVARVSLCQGQDPPLNEDRTLLQVGLQLDGCQPQLEAVLRVTEAGFCHVGGITGVALGACVAAVEGEIQQPEAGEAAVSFQAFGDALQTGHQLLTYTWRSKKLGHVFI